MGSDIPEGFRPYAEPSPVLERVGPLYQRQEGRNPSGMSLAPKFQGELYCGFAEDDPHVPRSEVDALAEALKPCAVKYQVEVHPGTEHGYSFPERDMFQKEAAERNWERIFAMFQRQLLGAAG